MFTKSIGHTRIVTECLCLPPAHSGVSGHYVKSCDKLRSSVLDGTLQTSFKTSNLLMVLFVRELRQSTSPGTGLPSPPSSGLGHLNARYDGGDRYQTPIKYNYGVEQASTVLKFRMPHPHTLTFLTLYVRS